MTEQLRLMCVHAHPDDESSKGAATMARYVNEGVDVLVATCTGGERGSVLNKKMDRPEVWRDIAQVRAKEMERAREILGVKQAWLGFVDSGLPEGWLPDSDIELPEDCFYLEPLEVAAAPLIRLIRHFKPHVVTTYDEDAATRTPDHIKTHQITMEAFDAAGDPDRYREFGEAWQPSKLYYNMSFGRARLTALHEAMIAEGLESPYGDWLNNRDWTNDKGLRVTTKVECSEYFSVRDDALRAHATQVDPDGSWFQVPMELQQKAWPTEDFELVKSHVEMQLPETDLFAGLR